MSRYEKGHKAETHRRVVEIAAQRFRSEGIDGVGVASLMADAGLTHGGFYAHFASKEALVKEALITALGSSSAYARKDGEESTAPLDLRAFIDSYLSADHRDRLGSGCAVAALAPEAARRPRATRNAFSKETQRLVARIASGLANADSPEARLAAAYGVFAQMVGTLQLSRTVADKALSDRLLAIGRANASRLAGFDPFDEAEAKPIKRKSKKH